MLGLRLPPGGDFGAMLCSWLHLHSQILLEKALPSGLRGNHSISATPFLWKEESCLGGAHPRCAAEGSRQWPARCQETLPKGSKFGYGKRRSLILSPKPYSCLGRALQKCPLNRSMLAYLGAMLGLCWPIWGLCWGHVRPSWGYVGALLTLRRWFWAKLFSWLHLHSHILLEKALASGLRASCLDSLSKICLFLSSPQWPAGFTFRAFLLPPVACESQVPPMKGGRGCRVVPP